ncbi:MAG: UDP-glucose 4-epimerase [Candidatus Yanofskybacteria bacterium CG10_big_fil_rev_8_21_14_0_10_37_15]|uniref:UDP-glucose 4-epimerase n=1 Tax=Candidatus Yanofskybacteria bacterium CG10_big_fil_rev_8_21_14_0_10_37_15 TaxID=1975097 RepID=A0A2H0R6Z4_9BACT|nr:MAG: UDP-glucose 4-epimerase [Candidatus Yanofskybacteria bacterium CG10_big_fil_rev_8_21_14_0_10_37_15]
MSLDYKKNLINKTVLITGGTGSFGNVMAKHILGHNPKKVIIFSRDEKKQFDMDNNFNDDRLEFVIGDVRHRQSVEHAMHGVDMVFHAAALKQVPNCEFFPIEAIRTNTLGSFNVINAAVDKGVESLVLLSTDKAVHPINVMGMSKALAERTLASISNHPTRCSTKLSCTRYGNVMYTRGSVIPFFISQMKAGKPLTVTNRAMTRFMMSLDDSVNLVLYALTQGKKGEVYVCKSPAATVGDLAQALVELFKYKKKIIETGIRPGEKIHETLISPEEAIRAVDRGDYYEILPESVDTDIKKYYQGKYTNGIPAEGYTSANTTRLTVGEIKKLLLSLSGVRQELKSFNKNGSDRRKT